MARVDVITGPERRRRWSAERCILRGLAAPGSPLIQRRTRIANPASILLVELGQTYPVSLFSITAGSRTETKGS
jgi:hypothetical protein